MRRLRTLTVVSVLALAGLTGFTSLSGCKKSEGKAELPPATGPGAPPLPELPTFAAAGSGGASGAPVGASETRTTGILAARDQVTVGARASGTIVELKVVEGATVKKNDVLFRLDSRTASLLRNQAATALKAAKLQEASVQREYDRVKQLVEQNAMPRQTLDTLQSQLDGAKIAVAQAQNALALTQQQIADATVRSPLDGVVVKKLMNVGEYATLMPPSPVLVIQDQSKLELRFRLPERALAVLGAKDAIHVTVPALGMTRDATIQRLSPAVDPTTGTIELIALLDNKDGAL